MSDYISREDAKDALQEKVFRNLTDEFYGAMQVLDELPSAQPEIIRCKDCKYHDEGYRRISVKWLPCMDIYPGSNWYCGSAERREE